jgi:hypothetical protein
VESAGSGPTKSLVSLSVSAQVQLVTEVMPPLSPGRESAPAPLTRRESLRRQRRTSRAVTPVAEPGPPAPTIPPTADTDGSLYTFPAPTPAPSAAPTSADATVPALTGPAVPAFTAQPGAARSGPAAAPALTSMPAVAAPTAAPAPASWPGVAPAPVVMPEPAPHYEPAAQRAPAPGPARAGRRSGRVPRRPLPPEAAAVLSVLTSRPWLALDVIDLVTFTGAGRREVLVCVEALTAQGRIVPMTRGNRVCYVAAT